MQNRKCFFSASTACLEIALVTPACGEGKGLYCLVRSFSQWLLTRTCRPREPGAAGLSGRALVPLMNSVVNLQSADISREDIS